MSMDKKKPMSKPWENNEPFIKFVKEYEAQMFLYHILVVMDSLKYYLHSSQLQITVVFRLVIDLFKDINKETQISHIKKVF